MSVATRPSVFGYTLYNSAFAHLNINMIYKPFQVTSEDQLVNVIAGIRGLGIVACSISMPYKETVMKHLDAIDSQAQKIGAINSIVNQDNFLTGYNTDYEGAKTLLEPYKGQSLLVLGTGGVSKAVILAGIDIGMKVTVCGRSEESLKSLSQKFNVSTISWPERNTYSSDVVINCTSVGMDPHAEELVLDPASITHFKVVGDLVMKPPKTILIREAENHGLKVIPGPEFMLAQFLHQFKLYTRKEVPADFARATIKTIV